MKPVTATAAFMRMPTDGGPHLFTINEGVEKMFALSMADCLDASVRYCLNDGIEGGMPSEIAYLCEFAMEVAHELRVSLGGVA